MVDLSEPYFIMGPSPPSPEAGQEHISLVMALHFNFAYRGVVAGIPGSNSQGPTHEDRRGVPSSLVDLSGPYFIMGLSPPSPEAGQAHISMIMALHFNFAYRGVVVGIPGSNSQGPTHEDWRGVP